MRIATSLFRGGLFLAVMAFMQLAHADAVLQAPVAMEMSVTLDPSTRALSGSATLTIEEAGEIEIELAPELEATRLEGPEWLAKNEMRSTSGVQSWRIPAGPPGRTVGLRWRGRLSPLDARQQHRDTLGPAVAAASPAGSFLPASALWYPRPLKGGHPLLHSWTLSLELPPGQKGLVPGTLIDEQDRPDGYRARFEFLWPGEGIDLMAGPYRIDEKLMRSIDGRQLRLRTMFAPELGPLADDYLGSVAGYIARYEAAVGPYPFTGFSVVSSPTPTGFGMPTLTYLGESVLRLPFIRHTSLGHEVLHNWWGNGVYPDYASGNWSEGLTTFMADYAYAEDASADKATEMRVGWLRDLAAIPPGEAMPLADFTSRHHGASQAVGYGKAAMLFVMLRDRIGTAAFERGLRGFWRDWRFKVASWRDLQRSFEQASGDDLEPFFAQWLTRPSIPSLELTSASKNRGELSVRLSQGNPPYQLDVPLRIIGTGSMQDVRVRLDKRTQTFTIQDPDPASRVVLDPDARMLRRLGSDEAPPILRDVLFDPRAELLVMGDATVKRAAQQLADRLLDHPVSAYAPQHTLGDATLLVIGTTAEVDRWLASRALPRRPPEVTGAELAMVTLRQGSGKPMALITARDAPALEAAMRPLPHYGKQSWLVIENGKVSRKGVWPVTAQSVAVSAAN